MNAVKDIDIEYKKTMKVLEDESVKVFKNFQENNSIQNVHTPIPLIEEITDKVELEDKTILIEFNIEMVFYLSQCKENPIMGEYKNKSFNYKSITFLTDIKSDKLNNILSQKGVEVKVANLNNLDTIDLEEMKSDVIISNPPYQTPPSQRERSDENLWLKFVDLGYRLLNENGKLLFITPPPIGKDQRTKKADYSVFLDNQVDFVKLLTNKEASTFFPGVGSKFSYYMMSKVKKHSGADIIIGENSTNFDLKDIVISPSDDKPGILEFFDLANRAPKIEVYSNYEGHSQNLKEEDYSLEKTDKHQYRFYITNKKRVFCTFKHSLYNTPKVVIFLFSALKDVEYNDELGFGENLKYIPVKDKEEGMKLVKMLNSKFYRYYSDNFRSGRALNLKGIPYFPWNEFESDEQVYDYFNVSGKLRAEIEANAKV